MEFSAQNFPASIKLQQENDCILADEFYTKPEIVSEIKCMLANQDEQSLLNDVLDSRRSCFMVNETCDINVEKIVLFVCFRCIKKEEACTSYFGQKRLLTAHTWAGKCFV